LVKADCRVAGRRRLILNFPSLPGYSRKERDGCNLSIGMLKERKLAVREEDPHRTPIPEHALVAPAQCIINGVKRIGVAIRLI
jgi:hypothetical protein